MKVAIIGYGFVGKALENGLKENVQTFLVDPKLKTKVNELNSFLPEIIFICVPTPMNNDGTQMISILHDVISDISTLKFSPLVVIKSTVLPKYLVDIENSSLEFIYNPEFLREKYANEDFINSELILFGGQKKLTNHLAEFYKNYTNCINKKYQQTDLVSASLIKYSINTFLSNKVIFFNELYNVFEESRSKDSWDNITKIISSDKRIGASHMQAPGHDGKFGFGGPCFPKDCQALFAYSKEINKPMTLLKQVIATNNIIRNSYETLSDREIEQNINYKDNK
jgi:UDPglucose 6-dehydrogenase